MKLFSTTLICLSFTSGGVFLAYTSHWVFAALCLFCAVVTVANQKGVAP